jgi:hypothetical protein
LEGVNATLPARPEEAVGPPGAWTLASREAHAQVWTSERTQRNPLTGRLTTTQPAGGLDTGLDQLNLNGQGIRAITWYAAQSSYLIIGGSANGGPLEREIFGEKYSLYSWDGSVGTTTQFGHVATPLKIIDDLGPFTVRPEGVAVITVNGEPRVLFVEDRFRARGYATRNIVHWPISILGVNFQSEP